MAGMRPRIALKSSKTLTYSHIDANMLLELKVQGLVQNLKAQLPQEEGLVIQSSIVSNKEEVCTYLGYTAIRTLQCSYRRKKKGEAKSKFCNRVGLIVFAK